MDRNSVRYFYAPPAQLRMPLFHFPEDEEHHLVHVLRLPEGTEVTAVDGEGNRAVVRLEREGDIWSARVVDRPPCEDRPGCSITLGAALLKGRETDSVVERCTEIGISRFIPFLSKRTVVTLSEERKMKRVERYRRLSLAAMKVARSACCPAVDPLATWSEMVKQISRYDLALLCDQHSTRPLEIPDGVRNALLLIGPEGGLTGEEKEMAVRAGAGAVSFGDRNLRASTAAVVACALAARKVP